jgi:hypothetical protein
VKEVVREVRKAEPELDLWGEMGKDCDDGGVVRSEGEIELFVNCNRCNGD